MYKGSPAVNGTAIPACVSGGYAKCGQMSKKVCNGNYASHRAQNGECKVQASLVVSSSDVTPTSHQRRWSADFSKCRTSPVVAVRKNKKEPQPPQRQTSLTPPTASPSSFKRYSCPPMGIFISPRQSSSSSSSTSSSCSSPPPVPTSAITGHDPLGWKLQPKSTSASSRARSKRLSLQIPLPVILPDPESSPALAPKSDDTPKQDPSPKTKPPLKPKPFRRRHSDSSAFLRSVATPLPVVTLEELCAVQLRPVGHSDESDDVFSEENEEEAKASTREIPPPVPEKTSMARQIAQLIAHSRQRSTPVSTKTKEENIYTSVMKPKPKCPHQTVDHSSLCASKTAGLRLDATCDGERPAPRFPGREI